MEDIKLFLEQQNLQNYETVFQEHNIDDLALLRNVSEDDLKSLIPLIGDRIRLKKGLQQLKDPKFEFRQGHSSDLHNKEDPNYALLESIHQESVWVTAVQLFIPFLLAGLGTVSASYLFTHVQTWQVFKTLPELYILVIALLGLKGNLEMTLASRLSTHANLGHFENRHEKISWAIGNIALVLCQATLMGFLASLAAIFLSWISSKELNLQRAVILVASSVITAFFASLILGLVMTTVIIYSKKFRVNPDNIATPTAASLGDLITLSILSWVASGLCHIMDTHSYVAPILMIACLSLAPLWAFLASKNKYTYQVLSTGWSPVILAMIISSLGGYVLNVTVIHFKGVAEFQLIINGIGGNLVAVQASRMSTELHHVGPPGYRLEGMHVCITPKEAFWTDTKFTHGSTARMLLYMAIPGHIIFAYLINFLSEDQQPITFVFMLVYLAACLIQIISLLYIAQVMILSMWKRAIDPDNSAIPYLTAIGDLIGTLLLGIAFQFLYFITSQSDYTEVQTNITDFNLEGMQNLSKL